MACCLSCCKYTAIFGFIFYISMGFIVAFQLEYLKFEPHSQGNSIGACFITAFLELGIFIGLVCYQRKELQSTESRPQYLKLQEDRALNRQRQSSMKGIDMVDLKGLKREEVKEEEDRIDLL